MAYLQASVVLVITAYISSSCAGTFRDSFQVTFGPDLLHPLNKFYVDLPRTETDAKTSGWHSVSNNDCTNGGKYNGHRYILGSDTSLSLLFDRKGVIAGIQMNVNANSVKGNGYNYPAVTMYVADNIEGTSVYTLTAYFIQPSTICSVGREIVELNNQGTATGLFFQDGPNPSKFITVPLQRAAAISQGWTKNSCFPGMGYHNFFESLKYQDSKCTAFRPAFILYNAEANGDLHGFGLAALGKASSINNRYEYPPKGAIELIVGKANVAQCLLEKADTVGLTTMHVYFTNNNVIKHLCL